MLDIVRWAEIHVGLYVDRSWTGDGWDLAPAPVRLASYDVEILRHLFTPSETGRSSSAVLAAANSRCARRLAGNPRDTAHAPPRHGRPT